MSTYARVECYLVLTADGPAWQPAQTVKADRVTQKQPSLTRKQRTLKLSIDVPRALFATPQLAANIRVPEDAVSAPTINVETVTAIEEMVSRELGVALSISVVDDEER